MASADRPYLPEVLGSIFPSATSDEFWARCGQHELVFQQCKNCGTFRSPPVPICHVCRSMETEWSRVEGAGTVYSYTVIAHPVHPGLSETVPYNVCVVEFPDAPGVRLITNVVDVEPGDLEVGMPVRLHWEDQSNGRTLPRFERA